MLDESDFSDPTVLHTPMSEVRLSSKGQLVIPKSMRKKLSLKSGDKVKIEIAGGKDWFYKR